jgi:hypothetical protein
MALKDELSFIVWKLRFLNVPLKQCWQSCFSLEAAACLLPVNTDFKSCSTGLATILTLG